MVGGGPVVVMRGSAKRMEEVEEESVRDGGETVVVSRWL